MSAQALPAIIEPFVRSVSLMPYVLRKLPPEEYKKELPKNLAWYRHGYIHMKPHRDGTSGYAGVSKRGPRFRAYYDWQKVRVYLGSFATAQEAAQARKEALRELRERLRKDIKRDMVPPK